MNSGDEKPVCVGGKRNAESKILRGVDRVVCKSWAGPRNLHGSEHSCPTRRSSDLDLKSLTSGTGSFETSFSHYDPISGKIADDVIAAAKEFITIQNLEE